MTAHFTFCEPKMQRNEGRGDAYKLVRIFRSDPMMVLILKVVDIAGPSERKEWPPTCTVHEHGHWSPAVNT